MRFKTFFVVFSTFIIICCAHPMKKKQKCGTRVVFEGNIWNGEPVEPNSWPWLVAFRFKSNNKFFCGGSLVSARHVVSAAHCFHEKYQVIKTEPYEITTIVGKHNFYKSDEKGSVVHDVFDIFLHKDWDYNEVEYDADISIILLENKVDLSKRRYVSIVCLPPASEREPTGTGTVAGWGISKWSDVNGEPNDMTPNELQLPIVSQSQCFETEENLRHVASNRTFCAGFSIKDDSIFLKIGRYWFPDWFNNSNQNKAVCKGDSGGGLFKLDESTKAYNLAGIISSSLRDPNMRPCRTDTYSVFTDVSKFVEWIEMKINETMEIKWEEVDFECENEEDYTSCSTEFNGPYTRYLKIRQQFSRASDIEKLGMNFGSSGFIFAGVGENFPKLKKLAIIGSIKIIEKRNFNAMELLEELNLDKNKIEFLTEDVFSVLVNLKGLELSSSKIQNLPEKVFSGLVNLEKLSLSSNQIKKLPEKVFSGLVNLKVLYLQWNQILQNLPEKVFTGLVNLKELYLQWNQIQNLPEKVFSGLVNLEKLNLNNNRIKKLPEKVFSSLVNLKELWLNENQIQNLPEKVFTGLVNLEELWLQWNQIQNLPEKVFIGLVNLKELFLSSNQIQNLPEKVFTGFVNLKELWLNENQIQNLPEKVFTGLGSLKELELQWNQIQNLSEKVFTGLVNLEILNLEYNQIQNLPEKVFSDLVSLRELRLTRNQIQNLPKKVFSGLAKLKLLYIYKKSFITDNFDFSMNPNVKL